MANEIILTKPLVLAPEQVQNVVQQDSRILLYDYTGTNWAGIGVDTGGHIWVRTGTAKSSILQIREDGQLNVANTIYSAKPLVPAPEQVQNVVQQDSKILLYDYTGANWAGIGVDAGGAVWIRAGTADSRILQFTDTGALILNNPTAAVTD